MCRIHKIDTSRLIQAASLGVLLFSGCLFSGSMLAAGSVEGEGVAKRIEPEPVAQSGGSYTLVSSSFISGATTMSGGTMSVAGVVGQPVVGSPSGGTYGAQTGIMPTAILAIGNEGDVSPRSLGSGSVDVLDWVQTGRFAVQLDVISSVGEFQRADCAPRSSLGDGAINVSDWVQAGRYSVGLDSATAASGPTQAGSSPVMPTGPADSSEARELRLLPAQTEVGENLIEIPVMLRARGEENALTFSISYDSEGLQYIATVPGSDTAVGAEILVNDRGADAGRLGFGLRLAVGASIIPGDREILRLRFRRLAGGEALPSLTNSPVASGLAGRDASPLLMRLFIPERRIPIAGLD